jgi:O-antigen/teichoic acid export membrane protein
MGFLRLNSEIKGMIKTSLPLVVVELVSSLYSLTDTYFVSRLGEEAVAAVGISMYLFMLIQTMASLFTIPAIVFTSQSLGSGRRDLARRSTGEVLAYGLVASIAYSTLFAWMTPIPDLYTVGYYWEDILLCSRVLGYKGWRVPNTLIIYVFRLRDHWFRFNHVFYVL